MVGDLGGFRILDLFFKKPVREKIRKRERDDGSDDEEKPARRRKDSSSSDENVLSLKQAKFDVFKFGIKGFGKKEQEDAKAQLAIKLGAKVRSSSPAQFKEELFFNFISLNPLAEEEWMRELQGAIGKAETG